MLLVDGDILVYRAGFSSETRHYEVKGEKFSSRTEAVAKAKELGISQIKRVQNAIPKEEACHYLNLMIYRAIKDTKVLTGTDEYRVYLTDSNIAKNFRKTIDTNYKSNRKNAAKPVHYNTLRNHLMDNHKATVVSYLEADDLLGIYQTDKTVVASIDKDLLMVPGFHYNFNSKEIQFAFDPGELWLDREGSTSLKGHGFKFFCAQLLMGDATDAIQGVKWFGPVKTYNILKDLNDVKSLFNAVSVVYSKHSSMEKFMVNCNLLWILRNEGEYFLDWAKKEELL